MLQMQPLSGNLLPDTAVSCTAPATKCIFAHPLQMSYACHRETATKPSGLAHYPPGAESLAPGTQTTLERPKAVVRTLGVFFDLCFVPQRHSLFEHLDLKKCSEHGVLFE